MTGFPSQKGFSLVEVLVALAVLTIAMAALIGAAARNTSNQSYLEQRIFAHWVAMNHVAEIRLQEDPPAPGTIEGSETLGGREWHWRTEVSATSDSSVQRLDVEVYQEGEDDSRYATLTSFLVVQQ
jgi:general secretion pathway protein I